MCDQPDRAQLVAVHRLVFRIGRPPKRRADMGPPDRGVRVVGDDLVLALAEILDLGGTEGGWWRAELPTQFRRTNSVW